MVAVKPLLSVTTLAAICILVLNCSCRSDHGTEWVYPPLDAELDKYLDLYESGTILREREITILDRNLKMSVVAEEYGNAWGFAELPAEFSHLVVVPSVSTQYRIYVCEIPKNKNTSRLMFIYYERGADGSPMLR
jgi:hypothetical protein